MIAPSRLLAVLAVLATAVGLVVAGPTREAEAVSATDFDPGMIITDALFYDSDAMTAAEVQAFLETKVPTCHPEKDSNPSDVTCMKDYVTTTVAKAANANCKAIPARTATAAEVIDLVARACGISQQVLLVILQKEQGLVTHDWPSSYRYTIAMGYGCPDDDTGCKDTYYGFFKQLYMAAWQFKQYRANPTGYSYRAGRTNVIKYHPDSSCGTADVYIENQATAGLYNYTPYVPTTAALAAWPGEAAGTAKACGTYGNRNFFMFYSNWFGPTTGYPVDARLAAAYDARGGQDVLGAALDPAVSVSANGGGIYQRMENGTLYLTSSGIAAFRQNTSVVTTAYAAAGGPAGAWGWPIVDAFKWNGLWMTEFQNTRVAVISGAAVAGYPFDDVSDNPDSNDYTTLAEHVWWMADQGISEGWTTSTGVEFRPRQTVNRDVMAAFLYRFVDAEFDPGEVPTFLDVWEGSNPFYAEIEWLGTTGISNGWVTTAGREYRPLTSSSREQMAAFLYRLAAPEGYTPPAVSPFVDVSTSSAFYTEICWLYQSGISTGWSTAKGAEFRPRLSITREQMAAFLHRFAELDAA